MNNNKEEEDWQVIGKHHEQKYKEKEKKKKIRWEEGKSQARPELASRQHITEISIS